MSLQKKEINVKLYQIGLIRNRRPLANKVPCLLHTIYPGNNMCQKCGRKSGLWVLHEIMNKAYAENMKKIVGAVWELPAK